MQKLVVHLLRLAEKPSDCEALVKEAFEGSVGQLNLFLFEALSHTREIELETLPGNPEPSEDQVGRCLSQIDLAKLKLD